MDENQLSYKIVGVALELHRNIGPGLLESAYENALAYDLRNAGLLVENKVIVEIKAVESLAPVHFAQVLTYLKLSQMKLGLLINFNCKLLKDGIHRLANNMH